LDLIPPAGGGSGLRILEMGTGSGAISLALASERSGATLLASDASPRALALARQNTRRHQLADRIHLFCGTWFDPLSVQQPPSFDMILSNPPYIRTPVIPTLQPEIYRFEPIMALDGGSDGLRAIQPIIRQAPEFLKVGGWLLLEIGHDQADAVGKICRTCGAYADVRFRLDYSGYCRVLQARKGA
jgi:release factor glutamine methyltransferase